MPAKTIKIQAEHLRSMCKIIETVTDKRSPSKASFHTLLHVDETGVLTLRAQSRIAVVDLETPDVCQPSDPYAAFVGSEMLCKFAKQLRDTVEIRLRAKDIVLQGGPTYRLPHVEVEEPHHPTSDVIWQMKVMPEALLDALKIASAFTDSDDTRGLGGVGLQLRDNGAVVRALGTEGSRLSWAQFKLEEFEAKAPEATKTDWLMPDGLISADAVRLVANAAWGAEPITVTYRRGWMTVEDDETSIKVQLVSGLLPSYYEQVLKHSVEPTRVRAAAADISALVQRVSIGMGRTSSVKLTLSEGKLVAEGHSSETGADMHDSMAVSQVEDGSTEERVASFNPRLLVSCLKPFGGQVTLEVGKPLDPMIIRPEGPAGERIAVLMPVRADR